MIQKRFVAAISLVLFAGTIGLVSQSIAASNGVTITKAKKAVKAKTKSTPSRGRVTATKTIPKAKSSLPAESASMGQATNQSPAQPVPRTAPPARDPQIAVQEEFDTAMATSTSAAWDLFVARHPSNPLTPRAKIERAKIGPPR
jgi:hypothetical protein